MDQAARHGHDGGACFRLRCRHVERRCPLWRFVRAGYVRIWRTGQAGDFECRHVDFDRGEIEVGR